MSSPPTVTPQRRRRDDDGDDGPELEVAPRQSATRKRQRLNHSHRTQDGERSEDEPLLPDSYRRSPKAKGRAVDAGDAAGSLQEHHPGSIVRVTMKTFVTYTHAEFLPGPNLNMIIGPNGTGKSTLVCAICLGLGWKPEHLGRAKDIGEFVKHGAREATIEIELKADPHIHASNPVITCIIARDGTSDDKMTTFKIDGRRSTRKAVQELVKKNYSIQVDNLCQFLPQDRVVEFAALSPVELLVQTQRAAAEDYMSDWHDQLKAMRKEQRQKQAGSQNLLESLKDLEHRQRSQTTDVEKLRQKEVLKARLNALEKMRPVAEYGLISNQHKEAKQRKKAAAKELETLRRRTQPNLRSMNDKEAYKNQLDRVVGQRTNLVDQMEKRLVEEHKNLESFDEKIKQCGVELQTEVHVNKEAKATCSKLHKELRNLQLAKEQPPPTLDFTAINQRHDALKARIQTLGREQDGTHEQLESLVEMGRQRQEMVRNEQAKRAHMQSQAGKLSSQIQRHSSCSAKLYDWMQANRDQFSSDVYGPAMVECSVKDRRYAAMAETAIGQGLLKSFTVRNRHDFLRLTDHGFKAMKLWDLSVNNNGSKALADYQPPMSREALKHLGLDGWVLDLLEGPEDVLSMLCSDRNLHTIPYADEENFDDTKLDAIGRAGITMFVTSKKHYITNRRYNTTSTKIANVKAASFFTDAPVSTQAEDDIGRRISELQDEIAQIREEISGVKSRDCQLRAEIKQLEEERDELKRDKAEKQKRQSAWQGLDTKIKNYERKLADAEDKMKLTYGKINAIKDKEADIFLKKGQQALDYARLVCTLRNLHEQLLEVVIMRIEAHSDVEQLRTQHEEETALLAQCQAEVERLSTVQEQLRRTGIALQGTLQQLAAEFTQEEMLVHQEIVGKMPEELETVIEEQRASLDQLGDTRDGNLIKEYEERALKIEHKRRQLETLQSDVAELETKIEQIRGRWEPELDELVGQISDAFAENFSRIQCAGEVAIYKDDDFEQWAIQIKVKFRENECLSILDSHRQSGGERAVSTIFYLMALQSLARAPFRVVDEINQGMDPRNERLVHSRMVDIACAEHTSQYFLITPKLLNGLKYHPNMKVHCIASGEYMPGSSTEQRLETFEDMARRALAIRNAA